MDKYLDLVRELKKKNNKKKPVEHEVDEDTNCSGSAWNRS